MNNQDLIDLIKQTKSRGGGMILSLEDQPQVVVLTLERYNQIINKQDPMDNKNVLVTGGAGYIGGHLVNELIKAGYKVTVLDNLSTGNKQNVNVKAEFVEGDLSDRTLLTEVFQKGKFTAVFHMAASLEVEESVKDPLKYFKNNVENAAKLLEVMCESGCKKIIFSSTAAVYGEPKSVPINETFPLKPTNPYGATKLLVERMIKYYCQFMGFEAVIFRYFNACGSGPEKIVSKHETHLVHNVIEVARGAHQVLKVFGNDYPTPDGTCVRDYVHVLDIALPHVLALKRINQRAETDERFEVFNIGTGKGLSVSQIVNGAAEVLNKIIPMEVSERRAGDPAELIADNTKLIEVLNYMPQHSDLESIIKTAWAAIQ